MCQFMNESQTHPLQIRVEILEGLLEDALAVLQAKSRPGEDCFMDILINEITAVLSE